MTCEQALAHPWMAAFKSKELTLTKSLSKEKMKRFLARQKWKVSTKLLFIYLFIYYLKFKMYILFSYTFVS